MGFTALDGLPMGTRPGQIDPGVVLYLIEQKGMSPQEVAAPALHDCGLKGLSGVSNDMRELEASSDPRAAFAIDYFVYRIALFTPAARGGARRPRRFRVHGGHRRELRVASCAGRLEAVLAGREARRGGERGGKAS